MAHQNFHRKAVVGGVDGLDPERLEDGFGLVPTWGFLGLGGGGKVQVIKIFFFWGGGRKNWGMMKKQWGLIL